MKKCILNLLFVFSVMSAYAAPKPYAHLMLYDMTDKDFFEKFVSKQTISYMVCVEEYTNGKHIKDDVAKNIFLDSLNNWLEKTKYYITKTKRETEFQDILDIVNIGTRLKRFACQVGEDGVIDLRADITVLYKLDASEYCDNAVACFLPQPSVLVLSTIDNNGPKQYTKFATHELGHAWGLADQYPGAIYDGSFLYNSKVKRPSIMDKTKNVTCDDVDGFITSIDRTLGKEREFYSLCSDGVFIKNGQAVIKENENYKFKENYDYFDAEIELSYNTGFEDSYIIDMTLNNFILNQDGLDFIQDMGFNITDLKTLRNVQVKIHGSALEELTETEDDFYMRTPIGLWTLVLYIKSTPKQVITKEYFSMEDVPLFTDLDNNSSDFIFRDIAVPLVNFLPDKGDGTKEKLRRQSYFKLFNFKPQTENKQIEKYQNIL